MNNRLTDLGKRLRRLGAASEPTGWSEYHSGATHYDGGDRERKTEWVRSALMQVGPGRALDVGANTGEYSVLAAELGCEVVALERDEAAADRLFRMSRRTRALPILTIQADLARPTPAMGWENRESSSLLARLEGKFEVVMMLAVIHHLILMDQIPLVAIIALCARLTHQHLIVEWVPVSDAMYQSLMRGRDDLYGSLSEASLLAACEGHFVLLRQQTLANGRTLFLFQKVA